MSDWADEIGLDICGPLPHARYVASALRQERGKSHIAGLREAAEMCDGHGAPMPVGAHHIHERILARIAELEKTDGS